MNPEYIEPSKSSFILQRTHPERNKSVVIKKKDWASGRNDTNQGYGFVYGPEADHLVPSSMYQDRESLYSENLNLKSNHNPAQYSHIIAIKMHLVQLNKLKHEHTKLKARCNQIEGENGKLKQKAESKMEYSKDGKELARLCSNLKDRLKEKNAELEFLDSQLSNMKKSIKSTRTAELESQNERLFQQNGRLRERLIELLEYKDKHAQDYEELRKATDTLKERSTFVKILEQEIAELSKNMKESQLKMEEYKKKFETADQKRIQETNNLKRIIKNLSKQLDDRSPIMAEAAIVTQGSSPSNGRAPRQANVSRKATAPAAGIRTSGSKQRAGANGNKKIEPQSKEKSVEKKAEDAKKTQPVTVMLQNPVSIQAVSGTKQHAHAQQSHTVQKQKTHEKAEPQSTSAKPDQKSASNLGTLSHKKNTQQSQQEKKPPSSKPQQSEEYEDEYGDDFSNDPEPAKKKITERVKSKEQNESQNYEDEYEEEEFGSDEEPNVDGADINQILEFLKLQLRGSGVSYQNAVKSIRSNKSSNTNEFAESLKEAPLKIRASADCKRLINFAKTQVRGQHSSELAGIKESLADLLPEYSLWSQEEEEVLRQEILQILEGYEEEIREILEENSDAEHFVDREVLVSLFLKLEMDYRAIDYILAGIAPSSRDLAHFNYEQIFEVFLYPYKQENEEHHDNQYSKSRKRGGQSEQEYEDGFQEEGGEDGSVRKHDQDIEMSESGSYEQL